MPPDSQQLDNSTTEEMHHFLLFIIRLIPSFKINSQKINENSIELLSYYLELPIYNLLELQYCFAQ